MPDRDNHIVLADGPDVVTRLWMLRCQSDQSNPAFCSLLPLPIFRNRGWSDMLTRMGTARTIFRGDIGSLDMNTGDGMCYKRISFTGGGNGMQIMTDVFLRLGNHGWAERCDSTAPECVGQLYNNLRGNLWRIHIVTAISIDLD